MYTYSRRKGTKNDIKSNKRGLDQPRAAVYYQLNAAPLHWLKRGRNGEFIRGNKKEEEEEEEEEEPEVEVSRKEKAREEEQVKKGSTNATRNHFLLTCVRLKKDQQKPGFSKSFSLRLCQLNNA